MPDTPLLAFIELGGTKTVVGIARPVGASGSGQVRNRGARCNARRYHHLLAGRVAGRAGRRNRGCVFWSTRPRERPFQRHSKAGLVASRPARSFRGVLRLPGSAGYRRQRCRACRSEVGRGSRSGHPCLRNRRLPAPSGDLAFTLTRRRPSCVACFIAEKLAHRACT